MLITGLIRRLEHEKQQALAAGEVSRVRRLDKIMVTYLQAMD